MKKIIILILAMFTVIISDQLSKHAILASVLEQVPLSVSSSTEITPHTKLLAVPTSFLNIVLTMNKGVSFSMLSSNAAYMPYILIAVSILIMLGIVYFVLTSKSFLEQFGLSLVLAGAIGNLIDRIRFKAVVDFLDFHWFGTAHFPAFNIADSAITIGAIIFIIDAIISARKKVN